MTQYNLYGGLPPHRKVDTSKEAAVSILPHVNAMQERVLGYIESHDGATDSEIEQGLKMLRQTVCARRNELMKLGLVKWSGEYRKADTGRRVRVWVATGGL